MMAYQLLNQVLHAFFLVVVVEISEVLTVFMHFGYLAFEVVCQSLVLELACMHLRIVLVVELCLHTLYHLLNTLSWNGFGFYVFPFSISRWWNWLVCISELFWGLNYAFILVNHLLTAIAWLLSFSIFSCLRSILIS